MTNETVRVALGQIAPVFLDRAATLEKVVQRVREAAREGCRLVAFGEALVPGYPVWVERTGGARFDAADQKELFALYAREAVDPAAGDLADVQAAARDGQLTVVLGAIERAADRGGKSLYCACITIGPDGELASVQRKLMPTYEERLVWSIGDGAGLVVHPLGPFTLGSLNCWENWMPLARAALHAQGEDLHVAVWPGGDHLTRDVTRHMAREGRSYVLSVGGLLRAADIPTTVPQRDRIVGAEDEVLCNGGSCLAAPDGSWVVEPRTGSEELVVAELDPARVREERHNFDPSGHYARPDVLRLVVDRRRQNVADFRDA